MTKSQSDETAIPWYTFVVEGNKIMGTNEQFEEGNNNIKNVTLNLNNSRIETVSVSYETPDSEYNMDYDTNGLWLGIDIDLDDSQKFKYDGNNFLGFENNAIFSYDTAAQQTAIFGVDVAKILYAVIIFDFFEEYQLQALCLNLTGKPSLSLPQSFDATGEGEQVSFTYTFDNDGYVTKVSWNKEGQDMYGITQKEQASYEFIYE